MKRFSYTEPTRMSHFAILEALESDSNSCVDAILSATWFEEIAFVEGVVTRVASHADPIVRGMAMIAIGHLARIHKDVEATRRLLTLLQKGLSDADNGVRGKAEDAAEDVEVFIPALADETSRIRGAIASTP